MRYPAAEKLEIIRRDCREFRVWPVMMGKKETSPHGPAQRADHP